MPNPNEIARKHVPPFGWPIRFRASIQRGADRPPLLIPNRYPRQVIGIGVRLRGKTYLSILWAKPARWWSHG